MSATLRFGSGYSWTRGMAMTDDARSSERLVKRARGVTGGRPERIGRRRARRWRRGRCSSLASRAETGLRLFLLAAIIHAAAGCGRRPQIADYVVVPHDFESVPKLGFLGVAVKELGNQLTPGTVYNVSYVYGHGNRSRLIGQDGLGKSRGAGW